MKNQWWLFGLRAGLGIVFIVASVTKLSAHSLFINEVLGYSLLPEALARVYAIVLPWVELFAGIALILSIFTTAALLLSFLMALSFAIANIYSLSQGISESCGSCFGQIIPLSLTTALILDILMIAASMMLLFFRKKTTPINIVSFFVSRLTLNTPDILKGWIHKIGQVFLLAVIVLSVGLPISLSEKASPVYQEIDTSLEQGKIVLIYFYMDGCGDCKEQEPIIDDLENLYEDYVNFIRVEYTRGGDTAVQFEVTRVPAMILITGKNDGDYIVAQSYSALTSMRNLQRGLYESPAAHSICEKSGPIAEFNSSSTFGYVPAQVQFTDASLADIEWYWEFDWAWDFDNDQVVDSRIPNPAYVYEKPGTYSVSLTLTGPCGSSSITKSDYLLFISKEDSATRECPVDFFAEPIEVDNSTPVQFFGESDGDIVSWKWDFDGDGTIDSTDRNPVHTYKEFGLYTVSLTIKAADCENRVIKQDYIRVMGCPCG
ncbi:PKD domain-containing protein [Chloroflexota bacterium]